MEHDFNFTPDEIGYWSEIKLQIIKDYAEAYGKVLNAPSQKKQNFIPVYIDAFSGAGVHLSKNTGEMISGSPMNALNIEPPFHEFYFIDNNKNKAEYLREAIGPRQNVHILDGDCNEVLLKEVFPSVKYTDYKRGLCLLDPYGLHLSWDVLKKAGEAKSIEIFLNFPIMDMNMNVLLRKPEEITPENKQRMNFFWGDNSWETVAFSPKAQLNLFHAAQKLEKTVDNEGIVNAFRSRLKEVASFQYVTEAIPMRNTIGKTVYYLFFASNNSTGSRIASHILKKYKNKGLPS